MTPKLILTGLIIIISPWSSVSLFAKARINVVAKDQDGWASGTVYLDKERVWNEGGVAKQEYKNLTYKDLSRGTRTFEVDPGKYRVRVYHRDRTKFPKYLVSYFGIVDRDTASASFDFASSTAKSTNIHAVRSKELAGSKRPKVGPLTDDKRITMEASLANAAMLEGVVLLEDYGVLPAGIIIQSIFHRFVGSVDQFIERWDAKVEGGQILIGFLSEDKGEWKSKYKMVMIPEIHETDIAQSKKRYEATVKALADKARTQLGEISNYKVAYQRELTTIAERADQMSADKLVAAITNAKLNYSHLRSSPEFTEIKSKIIESYTKGLPLAQKILVRTVTKTTDDREQLVLHLAKATISGGATVAPTLGLKAIDASMEVLVEEGFLTDDEANSIKVANTLVHALQGANDANTVLKSIELVSDSYAGLIECGVIDEDTVDNQIKARIKSGDQMLDLLIMLG